MGSNVANIFFTSDTHWSHENTWRLFKDDAGQPLRPFTSTVEMNETMIQRWNETVRPQDHIYHLGDVCMMRPRYIRSILERLNGHKRLVRGNHDIFKTADYLEWFEEIYGVRVLDNLLFSHIPVHPTSVGRFDANVHGHIHSGPNIVPAQRQQYKFVGQSTKQLILVDCPYINITVEHTNYRPLALEEVKALVKQAKAAWEEAPSAACSDTPPHSCPSAPPAPAPAEPTT